MWDWLLLFLILGLNYGPPYVFDRVISMFAADDPALPMTGAGLARGLLDARGLGSVRIEDLPAELHDLGDYYAAAEHLIRLSPRIAAGRSVAAYAVAAHEVGHARQQAEGYAWLSRQESFGRFVLALRWLVLGVFAIFAVIGVVSDATLKGATINGLAGLLLFSFYGSDILLRLLALPVEWNASFGHALPDLKASGLLSARQLRQARVVLTVAAATYATFALLGLVSVAVLLRDLTRPI